MDNMKDNHSLSGCAREKKAALQARDALRAAKLWDRRNATVPRLRLLRPCLLLFRAQMHFILFVIANGFLKHEAGYNQESSGDSVVAFYIEGFL